MKKRFLALLACGAVMATSAAGFVGCGEKKDVSLSDGNYKLTLWGPQVQQEWLGQVVKKFKAKYPKSTFDITLGVCGEGDVFNFMKTDPAAGANVFSWASDQSANLLSIGALARIGGDYLKYVESTNIPASVAAAKLGEGYYGYPFAADNGYFLYYNKAIVKNPDKLDDILKDCKAAGKKFSYGMNSGFYVPAWFFGAGCEYAAEYSDKGKLTSLTTNFDDATKGTIAAKAMIQLANHEAFLNGKGDAAVSGFSDGSIAAGVETTPNAAAIKAALGENYAATKLPKFTVDGKDYQMGSFAGYKLYGVNAMTPKENLPAAHALAAFLTSEEIQKERFTKFQIGPTNVEARKSEDFKNDVAQQAFNKQLEFAKPQLPVPEIFWTAVKTFGQEAAQKKITVENIAEKLKKMADDMRSVNPAQ